VTLARWPALLLSLGLALTACGSRPAATPRPSDGLAVSYAVDSVRPREAFELHVAPKGLARALLRSSWRGDPGGAVGFFAVRPTPAQRAELESVVREHALLARRDEPGFTREGSGYLRLAHGTRRGEVSLLSKDEGTRSLRLLLDGLLQSARQRPLAALKLASRARVDGPNALVDVALVHQGVKPLRLAIFEPKLPEGSLTLRVIFERGGRLADERFIAPDDLAKLIAKKKLPGGWHALAPGEKIVIPLPLTRLPAAPEALAVRVEASVLAQLDGQRAVLSMSSEPAPLEPEAAPGE